jgi:phenylacetate-CoA ligase
MKAIKKLISRLFIRISDIIFYYSSLKKFHYLEIMKNKDKSEIENIQLIYLKKIIEVAYNDCQYYQEKLNKNDLSPSKINSLEDLKKIPPTTKVDIRKYVNQMINSKIKCCRIKTIHSSGSTGQPKVFYNTFRDYSWHMASIYYHYKQAGVDYGDKILYIKDFKRIKLINKLSSFFSRSSSIFLQTFDENSLKAIVEKIERINPKIIHSRSITFFLLAEIIKKSKGYIRPIHSISTTGSILFPHYRELIENVFNTKVFDHYGGDGMAIACQCEYGNYHNFDLGVIMEVVDDNLNPVPEGTIGRILITDLHNKYMPIIRYEIGDMGMKIKGLCKCGSQYGLMAQPFGRDTDIIRLSNGVSLNVHQFGYYFRNIEEILQFQIREVGQDQLLILFQVSQELNERKRDQILKRIDELSIGQAQVEIRIVDEIPLEKSNKRRYMIGRG